MSEHGTERLARTVRAISPSSGSRKRHSHSIDPEPSSVYEIITRQMVEDMGDEIRDLRRRIDTLLFLVVATIIGDVILRLTGAGA